MSRPSNPPYPGTGTRPLTARELNFVPPGLPTSVRVGIAPVPTAPELWASPAHARHPASLAYCHALPLPTAQPPLDPDRWQDTGWPHLVHSVYFVWFPPSRRRPRLPAFGLPPGFDPLAVAADLCLRCWATADEYRRPAPQTKLAQLARRHAAELRALRAAHRRERLAATTEQPNSTEQEPK